MSENAIRKGWAEGYLERDRRSIGKGVWRRGPAGLPSRPRERTPSTVTTVTGWAGRALLTLPMSRSNGPHDISR